MLVVTILLLEQYVVFQIFHKNTARAELFSLVKYAGSAHNNLRSYIRNIEILNRLFPIFLLNPHNRLPIVFKLLKNIDQYELLCISYFLDYLIFIALELLPLTMEINHKIWKILGQA